MRSRKPGAVGTDGLGGGGGGKGGGGVGGGAVESGTLDRSSYGTRASPVCQR